MIHVPVRNLLASTLVLGISLIAAPHAQAQTAEVEPNQTCAAAQNLGAVTSPISLQGSLNTPPGTPDVDFYRVSATPGSMVTVELNGASTNGGTLGDPYLGVFNESCQLLAYNDDFYGTSSHVEIEVPASGTIVIAATSYGDWEFTGTGGSAGSYRLTVERQAVADSVSGRIVNVETGGPVPSAYVYLQRCDASGVCGLYAGGTYTDAQGAFRFDPDSYSLWTALVAGTYRITVQAGGYEIAETAPFALAEAQALDLGAVSIQPLPAVGSISGRLVDEITGTPLVGGEKDFAQVELQYCQPWGCYGRDWRQVGADGTFRFEGTSSYPLEPGTYQLVAYANQYQHTYSETFTVEDDQHFNFGDLRVKSLPVRINMVTSCANIPDAGGTCQFSMKVTNGSTTRLDGKAWGVVQGYWIGSAAQQTTFSVPNPRVLSLTPGESITVPFSFTVPGTVANGAYICVQGFAAQRPHEFNTLGTQSLFCLNKGINGFSQVPEAQKHEALKKAKGEAGPDKR
jgi:hypothetical protein